MNTKRSHVCGAGLKKDFLSWQQYFSLFKIEQNFVELLNKNEIINQRRPKKVKTLTGPIVLHDKLRSTRVLLDSKTCWSNKWTSQDHYTKNYDTFC